MSGTVEFAVFAPGDFQSFLDDNGILFSDPAPSEYIYAYQVVDIPAGDTVTNFSVGIDNDEAAGIAGVSYVPAATDYGSYPYVPTMDPANTSGGPGSGSYSVTWDAVLPSFGPGECNPDPLLLLPAVFRNSATPCWPACPPCIIRCRCRTRFPSPAPWACAAGGSACWFDEKGREGVSGNLVLGNAPAPFRGGWDEASLVVAEGLAFRGFAGPNGSGYV